MTARRTAPRVEPHEVRPQTEGPTDGPRIALVAQLDLPDLSPSVREILLGLTRVAWAELVRLGARVELHDVTLDAEPDLGAIVGADAIVMLGGGDVESVRYGVPGPVPGEGGVDPRSDERQLRIIDEAIDVDAAMLCICRGSQLLNVARGGSLVPDLPHTAPHRGRPGEPMFVDERLDLAEDSLIGRAVGARSIDVRSGHHQAVDRLGEGLRATAWAEDGVIEGTELESATWIAGIQWHPEDPLAPEADRERIFRAIVGEARRRRARRDA